MKIPTAVKTIQLTKIKQWYFPVDAESYKILRDAGFPLIRFHHSMLPTIKLALEPRGIRGRGVSFKDGILNPFLDKLGASWQAKDYRKATITSSTMKFESSKDLEGSKVAIQNLEACLRRFFTRWGFTAQIEYSDLRGKSKLHVTYKFDSNRLPVIPLIEDLETIPTVRFKLGHLRLALQLGTKFLDITIEEQTGNVWTKIKTSRCLYSQIGDVRPMMAACIDMVNREPHNFELPNA